MRLLELLMWPFCFQPPHYRALFQVSKFNNPSCALRNVYLSPKGDDSHFPPLETPKHIPPYALQLNANYTPLFSPFILRTEKRGLGYGSMNKVKGCWSPSSISVSSFSPETAMASQFSYQVTLFLHYHNFYFAHFGTIHSLMLRSSHFFLPVPSLSIKEVTMFVMVMLFAS